MRVRLQFFTLDLLVFLRAGFFRVSLLLLDLDQLILKKDGLALEFDILDGMVLALVQYFLHRVFATKQHKPKAFVAALLVQSLEVNFALVDGSVLRKVLHDII